MSGPLATHRFFFAQMSADGEKNRDIHDSSGFSVLRWSLGLLPPMVSASRRLPPLRQVSRGGSGAEPLWEDGPSAESDWFYGKDSPRIPSSFRWCPALLFPGTEDHNRTARTWVRSCGSTAKDGPPDLPPEPPLLFRETQSQSKAPGASSVPGIGPFTTCKYAKAG